MKDLEYYSPVEGTRAEYLQLPRSQREDLSAFAKEEVLDKDGMREAEKTRNLRAQELRMEFKRDLLVATRMTDHPLAEKLFEFAYARADKNLEAVEDMFTDLADIIRGQT